MFKRWQSCIRDNGLTLVLLMACSVCVSAPLLWNGPSCGHDFDFHLLSWMETAHDWHHGLFDPQWLATANYGAGEPRFLFYPPASWILGAMLGGIGTLLLGPQQAWTVAPGLLTFLCVFSAGVCVFMLARIVASRMAANIAACLFVVNPYLLFVAYERTAYGELLATPLIALLLICSLRPKVPVIALALVVAALWFTNAPAAVMGCYTLAFLCCLRLLVERSWRNVGRATAATILGMSLAGCYLVPAIWQQRWVQIGRAVSSGMRIEDSFLFRHTGQPYHDEVLRAASVIVVVLFGVAAVSLCIVFFRKRGERDQTLKIFAVLLAIIFLFQFPVSLPLWKVAPHLIFLQFPWRWMLVVSLVTACLVAAALMRMRVPESRSKVCLYAVTLLIVVASTWICSRRFVQFCDEQDRVSGQMEAFHSGSGVEGTDEYTASGADNSAIFQDLPDVRLLSNLDAEEPKEGAGDNPEWDARLYGSDDGAEGEVHVAAWQPEEKQIELRTKQPAFAVLKLMDYPAWNVLLNGRPVIGRLKREDGLMVIAVAAGSSEILVHWRNTPDVILGRELSATALIVLLMLFILQHKRQEVSEGTSE